jgi:hypothetical protein
MAPGKLASREAVAEKASGAGTVSAPARTFDSPASVQERELGGLGGAGEGGGR